MGDFGFTKHGERTTECGICGFFSFCWAFYGSLHPFFAWLGFARFLWLALLSRHFERSEKSIDKVWILRLRLRMTRFKQTPCGLLVILSDSEVSTNLKCEFALLKHKFFTLNLKCVLNFVDFSLSSESSK